MPEENRAQNAPKAADGHPDNSGRRNTISRIPAEITAPVAVAHRQQPAATPLRRRSVRQRYLAALQTAPAARLAHPVEIRLTQDQRPIAGVKQIDITITNGEQCLLQFRVHLISPLSCIAMSRTPANPAQRSALHGGGNFHNSGSINSLAIAAMSSHWSE